MTVSFVAASHAVITCPQCGHQERERLPTDSCQFFYDCKGCSAVLRPKAGDCCVYCTYGDVACPSIQEARAGVISKSGCACC